MKLLVSVRSASEALDAVAGGADLIDIKEPDRGTLGRADDAVIAAVVDAVAARRPLSAAMGELRDAVNWHAPSAKLRYIKFGLAGCRDFPWQERLLELRAIAGASVVPAAYADWERSGAPPVEEVADFVAAHHFPVMLIDTFEKDGRNVFSFLSAKRLCEIIAPLAAHGCQVALAGSLSDRDLAAVAEICPAWLAVRGAACVGGNRQSRVDVGRVRFLKNALSEMQASGLSAQRV